MPEFRTLDDFEVAGKRVLVRIDVNSPLDPKTLEIADDSRIRLVIPTLLELVQKRARLVLLAHQGRPGDWDYRELEPHAKLLGRHLGHAVRYIDDLFGEKAKKAIEAVGDGEVLLLKNVRSWKPEQDKKSPEEHAKSELVTELAPLFDLYVNDAFAAAHRSQASLVGFSQRLPAAAGRLMEKELSTLEKVFASPAHPSACFLGGTKFSDAIVTIGRLLATNAADFFAISGLGSLAFLKARGVPIGAANEAAISKEATDELLASAGKLLADHPGTIYLPVDFAVEREGKREEVPASKLPADLPAKDIGPKTLAVFRELINHAKTLFLSGPPGVFEEPLFATGTQELFGSIAASKGFTVAGGGHTIAALDQLGLAGRLSYVSTGGGAMEAFMLGKSLPVVDALVAAARRTPPAAPSVA